MEDALVPPFIAVGVAAIGLNPCFNGRCTRTMQGGGLSFIPRLNPCFNGRCTRTG